MDLESIQRAEDRRRDGGHRPAGREEPAAVSPGWPTYRLYAAAHRLAQRCDGHKGEAIRAFTQRLTPNDRLSFSAHYYAEVARRHARTLA